jgi:hypothetical protein
MYDRNEWRRWADPDTTATDILKRYAQHVGGLTLSEWLQYRVGAMDPEADEGATDWEEMARRLREDAEKEDI